MSVTKLILVAFLTLIFCDCIYAQQTIPEDTFITLDRKPDFFANCPFYKLTITADGTVELEVKNFNGQFKEKVITDKFIKSKISQEQLNQLISEFEKIDFYSLKSTFENPAENSRDECPEHWTDSATTIISITINGKSKKVERYNGCRGSQALEKLTNLENKIDEIVNIKQWVDCLKGKNRVTLSGQTK